MSIQTSDCSLSMFHSDGLNGYKELNAVLNGWLYLTLNAGQMDPDRECVYVGVCWSRILACQQFDLRAVSYDWTASSSSVSLQSSRLKLRFKFGLWFVMKFARPLPLGILFRAVAMTGRNKPSQLKIVCSLASSGANRSSVEILGESSSWWRRHDPRTSLFVCIHALKFQSKPWLTFTSSGRLPLLFPCVVFAVSRGANVMSLDNPSAVFWTLPSAEQRADTTAAAARRGGSSPLPLLPTGGSEDRTPQHQPTQHHLPLDTRRYRLGHMWRHKSTEPITFKLLCLKKKSTIWTLLDNSSVNQADLESECKIWTLMSS